MRVIAGTARSIPLVAPKGDETRPTTDRIKETLFNVIQTDFPGRVFVDLFAGSGGIGIESLSRGASKCYFVDNSKDAIDCIEKNLKKTKLEDLSVVLKQDAVSAVLYSVREEIGVLFLDPPYGKGYDRQVLENAAKAKSITEDSLIIVEESKDADFSYAEAFGFDIIKEKIYKSNKHVFLRRK